MMIPKLDQPPYADYACPEPRRSPLARLSPTAAFYCRVTRIVLLSAWRAGRGRFGDEEWYDGSLVVRKAFERGGSRIFISGTGHIAKLDEPCVIIGNHMSTAETFLLASMILPFRRVTFVVKRALVEYPIFKYIMRSRDPVVVGRENPRDDLKAVIGDGRERLERGMSVVIFPQRTRTVTFHPATFNTIGVKLAKRAGVPVVPLALKTNAWSNGRLLKDYGPFRPGEDVRFEFGEPIRIAGNDREVHEAVIAFIRARLEKWGVPVED